MCVDGKSCSWEPLQKPQHGCNSGARVMALYQFAMSRKPRPALEPDCACRLRGCIPKGEGFSEAARQPNRDEQTQRSSLQAPAKSPYGSYVINKTSLQTSLRSTWGEARGLALQVVLVMIAPDDVRPLQVSGGVWPL